MVWAEEGHPERVHSLTLGQLRRRCVRVAVALKSAGIQPGGWGWRLLWRQLGSSVMEVPGWRLLARLLASGWVRVCKQQALREAAGIQCGGPGASITGGCRSLPGCGTA